MRWRYQLWRSFHCSLHTNLRIKSEILVIYNYINHSACIIIYMHNMRNNNTCIYICIIIYMRNGTALMGPLRVVLILEMFKTRKWHQFFRWCQFLGLNRPHAKEFTTWITSFLGNENISRNWRHLRCLKTIILCVNLCILWVFFSCYICSLKYIPVAGQ